jgi:2-polyprenyl-3-methyl-5-hydroxy-6-metoxy-1,4-benzoquinol methylase
VARRAREHFRLDVVAGLVEESVGRQKFEVICGWHVIEHLPEPLDAIRHVRDALVSGGVLLAEVPNCESLRARREGLDWYHLDLAYHPGQYSPKPLSALLERAGLRVMSVEIVASAVYRRPLRRVLSHTKHAVTLRDWPFGTHPWKHELLRVVASAP